MRQFLITVQFELLIKKCARGMSVALSQMLSIIHRDSEVRLRNSESYRPTYVRISKSGKFNCNDALGILKEILLSFAVEQHKF